MTPKPSHAGRLALTAIFSLILAAGSVGAQEGRPSVNPASATDPVRAGSGTIRDAIMALNLPEGARLLLVLGDNGYYLASGITEIGQDYLVLRNVFYFFQNLYPGGLPGGSPVGQKYTNGFTLPSVIVPIARIVAVGVMQ